MPQPSWIPDMLSDVPSHLSLTGHDGEHSFQHPPAEARCFDGELRVLATSGATYPAKSQPVSSAKAFEKRGQSPSPLTQGSEDRRLQLPTAQLTPDFDSEGWNEYLQTLSGTLFPSLPNHSPHLDVSLQVVADHTGAQPSVLGEPWCPSPTHSFLRPSTDGIARWEEWDAWESSSRSSSYGTTEQASLGDPFTSQASVDATLGHPDRYQSYSQTSVYNATGCREERPTTYLVLQPVESACIFAKPAPTVPPFSLPQHVRHHTSSSGFLRDIPTGGADEAIQSLHVRHPTYLPYPPHSPWKSLATIAGNGQNAHDSSLLQTQPPCEADGLADSACADDFAIFDYPLCSSPTSFSHSLPLDVDIAPIAQLGHQTQQSSSSSSYGRSTHQTSCGGISAPGITREAIQSTTVYPQTPPGNITVVCQRRYQERRTSRMLSGVPPQIIELGPHGYPVSSVRKGTKLAGLRNAERRAFLHVNVGQKLSWRFLFDGLGEFSPQLNVLNATKAQPTVERIVVETVKALKRFKAKEPRFIHDLPRLVILKIELVSRASVQAEIGVLGDVTAEAAQRG